MRLFVFLENQNNISTEWCQKQINIIKDCVRFPIKNWNRYQGIVDRHFDYVYYRGT